ncbi:MAG: hypothetical protein ACRDGT_02180 [Candidatus Limnocylindria bacterium]
MPEILRGGLRIAMLVLVASLAMLPFQDRASAEFYVSLLGAIIGGLYVLGIVLALRWLIPRPPVRIPHRDKVPKRVLTGPAAGSERPGSGEKGRT